MKRLTSKDLMVGDWVTARCPAFDQSQDFHPMRVNGFQNLIDNGYILEPIPITPEILEKNGFRRNITPSDGIHPKDEYYFWENGDFYISLKKYDHWKAFVEKTEGVYGRRTSFQGYIDAIHELQHALRLCDINKEIEL